MSRAPARFRQSDIARALRAAKQAGTPVAVDLLPDGTIRLTPAELPAAMPPKDSVFDPHRKIVF